MNLDDKPSSLNSKSPAEEKIAAAEAQAVPEGSGQEEVDWKTEAEKNLELYLRSQAEMENMRKRLEREKTDFLKFANENLIKDLLPILDNLERALDHAKFNESTEGFLEGLKLIYESFVNTLTKFGIKPVPALGQRFDPHVHEAVMQREDPDAEENTVLEEVQKGYFLNDRLVRPSMVVVSRRPVGEVEN